MRVRRWGLGRLPPAVQRLQRRALGGRCGCKRNGSSVAVRNSRRCLGMSRVKRAKEERAIKRAMSGCMAECGFQVSGWAKTGKRAAPISRER